MTTSRIALITGGGRGLGRVQAAEIASDKIAWTGQGRQGIQPAMAQKKTP